MTAEVQRESVYAYADGAPFTVRWAEPGHAALTFVRDASHWPSMMTPLAEAVERLFSIGGERAFQDSGVPPPSFFQPRLVLHGYVYLRRTPPPPAEAAARQNAAEQLTGAHGGSLGLWERYCRPRIEQRCTWLQTAADTTPLAELAGTAGYAWALTHIHTLFYEFQRMVSLLGEHTGPEAEMLTNELTQGYPNASLAIQQELWQIGQTARATPDAERILRETPLPQVRAELEAAGATAVMRALDALLARYGHRSDGWELDCPTWQERPETPLGLIRLMLLQDSPEPAAVTRRGAERRELVRRRIEGQLSAAPAALEGFHGFAAPLAGYVAIREDRALWQMTVTGSLRGAVLRHGARLVRQGLLTTPADVFFLLPEEIEGTVPLSAAVAAARVAERRRGWQERAARRPPALIGADAPATPTPAAPSSEGGSTLLKGIAASRGTHTGRARVIFDPYQADSLTPGDVLVCMMTTPAWTPLIAVAGALVTDTGMAGSHPAIAAREFGIPAVVSATQATGRIPDGALVRVDGTAGTVEVVGS